MCDISINVDSSKFNFRVAIIPYFSNKILLQKSENDSYISLLGGRVKFGENTKQAIVRETEEELGLTIDFSKLSLINVCENFFVYKEKNIHEILFVYKVELTDLKTFEDIKIKDKTNVVAKWYDFKDLKTLNIMPEFIKHLSSLDEFLHIIIN